MERKAYDGFERRVQRAYGDKGEKLVNLVYKFAKIKRVAVKYEKQASFILPTRSPYIEASQAITEAERLIKKALELDPNSSKIPEATLKLGL